MGTMIWVMALTQFLPPSLPWGDCIIELNSPQRSMVDRNNILAPYYRNTSRVEKLIADQANRAKGKQDDSKTVIVTNMALVLVGRCAVQYEQGDFTNRRLMLRFDVRRLASSRSLDPRSWLADPNAARLMDDEGRPWKIDRETSLNKSLFEAGRVDFLEIWAEAPKSTSRSVILTLPAPEFGQTGEFRFRLKGD